jgi:glutathione peroxidase
MMFMMEPWACNRISVGAGTERQHTQVVTLRMLLAAGSSAMLMCGCVGSSSETERSSEMNQTTQTATQPLDISLVSISGDSTSLSRLGGKAFLVVNVASECGFTPQYEALEKLYELYSPKGLAVVGFPCNQFGGQEPGSEAQILAFCQSKYNVSFPLMSKIEVKGDSQHPLYRYLTRESGRKGEIQWNFTKFLLDSKGNVVARFEPQVEPLSDQVKQAIEALL